MAQGVDGWSHHGASPHCAGYCNLGQQLARKEVLVKSDNLSVVAAINKGSCREAVVVHLLLCTWLFVADFDIKLVAEQLPSKDSTIADLLSRNNLTLERKKLCRPVGVADARASIFSTHDLSRGTWLGVSKFPQMVERDFAIIRLTISMIICLCTCKIIILALINL